VTSAELSAQTDVARPPAAAVARAVAFFIDVVGTTFLTGIVFFTCFLVGFNLDTVGNVTVANAVLKLGVGSLFLVPIGALLLNLRLSRTRRASVGQLAAHIRLIDERTGGPVSVGGFFARTLVLAVPVVATASSAWTLFGIVTTGAVENSGRGTSLLSVLPILLVVWLVFAFPMLRGDRRGWQDKAGMTRVVTAA